MKILSSIFLCLLIPFFAFSTDEVKVTVTNAWSNGYSAKIDITPNANVESWEIKVNFSGSLAYYSSWNTIAVVENGVLIIKSKPEIAKIEAGSTLTLDFNSSNHTSLPTYLSHTFELTGNGGDSSITFWEGTNQNENINNTNSGHVSIGLKAQDEPKLTTSYYKHTISGRVNIIGNTNALEIWSPIYNSGWRHYLTFGIETFSNGTEYSVIGSNEILSGSVRPKHLLFQTNTTNGGGNVGVGSFSVAPIAKLTIAPNTTERAIAVINNNSKPVFQVLKNGNVWATKISVALEHDFPDYVFKKDYELMSLDSLSAYLDKENHLPNIPTAETVKLEGMDLGELTRLQQEKIEELTLYLIELHKKILILEAKL